MALGLTRLLVAAEGLLGIAQLEHAALRERGERRARLGGGHRMDVHARPAGFDLGREAGVGEEAW